MELDMEWDLEEWNKFNASKNKDFSLEAKKDVSEAAKQKTLPTT